MSPIVVVGALSSLVAAVAVLVLLPRWLRMPWQALAAAVAAALATIAIGWLLDAGTTEFLFGVSAFSLPVLVLLAAAAQASGTSVFTRWAILLVWALVVFPSTLIVPLLVTRNCLALDCGFTDFAAALPLVVSSSAFVLFAWLPARVSQPLRVDPPSIRRMVAATALLWLAITVWLAHLEGMVDAYTPRIAVAALVAPIATAAGWLVADRLRVANRNIGRSLLLGLLVGMIVTLPGAVSVGVPWLVATAMLAGAAASLAMGLVERATPTLATRIGATVLVAVAVGFIAPAVSGEGGLIFSARAAVLVVPLLVLLLVAAFSAAVSIPTWLLVRRQALREHRPAQTLADP